MSNTYGIREIELYDTLIAFKRANGPDALAALLRKLGVKSPQQIHATQIPKVQMLCKAGARKRGVVEGEATSAADQLDTAVESSVVKWGGPRGVNIADALTLMRGAPNLQEGFNRLAFALHMRGAG